MYVGPRGASGFVSGFVARQASKATLNSGRNLCSASPHGGLVASDVGREPGLEGGRVEVAQLEGVGIRPGSPRSAGSTPWRAPHATRSTTWTPSIWMIPGGVCVFDLRDLEEAKSSAAFWEAHAGRGGGLTWPPPASAILQSQQWRMQRSVHESWRGACGPISVGTRRDGRNERRPVWLHAHGLDERSGSFARARDSKHYAPRFSFSSARSRRTRSWAGSRSVGCRSTWCSSLPAPPSGAPCTSFRLASRSALHHWWRAGTQASLRGRWELFSRPLSISSPRRRS